MPGTGLSKADREIIAQGKKAEELQSKTKRLFGVENTDVLIGLPGIFGKEKFETEASTGSDKKRGRSQSAQPALVKSEKGNSP
ncbi:hypothetical protein OnM2_065038 [Erysiphe neolycopersici]|uniref:Uncharacterized protein n=1 Tax=Erysiphe neolycopersici TaxID=212602 RepID=A0A420HN23_9PEZI|nr:hypothetical protein OnM2_065038 [Erysiphe neolycopersici]